MPLAVGDRLLLCTDGLTGKLSDTQLQSALGADLPLPELGQSLMAQALAAGPGDNITLVLIEITALDAETTVPLPQPPAEELSQTRRFEVPAARIAEQETQRRRHAHARRREIILTVAVVLAVLAAVIAALWLAVGSIPRKPRPRRPRRCRPRPLRRRPHQTPRRRSSCPRRRRRNRSRPGGHAGTVARRDARARDRRTGKLTRLTRGVRVRIIAL